MKASSCQCRLIKPEITQRITRSLTAAVAAKCFLGAKCVFGCMSVGVCVPSTPSSTPLAVQHALFWAL